MMQLHWVVGLVLIAWASSVARSAPPSHAKASLIAGVSAIQMGKPFTIGVLVEIDPGWHIYWTNPGDSGLPTRVKFSGPEGYMITPQPFPVPRQLKQNGNVIAYGYEDAVLFTAQVTPPAAAHVGDDAKFDASISWLVCKEECMPGKASANLSLKVADVSGAAHAAEFDRYATTVTPAAEKSPAVTEMKSTIDSATHVATITLKWKEAVSDVQLFPGTVDGVQIGPAKVGKSDGDQTTISLSILTAGEKVAADRVSVLIAFRDKSGKTRGSETSVPVK